MVASTGSSRETSSPSSRAIWLTLAGCRGMPPASMAAIRARAFCSGPGGGAGAAGVRAARERGEEGLSHQLFAVRTLGLGGRLAGSALPDYLSGLLIGHELRAGLAARDADAPLVLVGEPALCQRYASALALFDLAAPRLLPNTAALGLWRLSQSF